MLICNTLLQSRIITAATTIVPWCFQCQFWGVFTSAKDFFFQFCLIRSTHPEIFFNEIGNIHPKVFFLKNSCSEYFGEIPRKTSVTKLIFSIAVSFQYRPCCKWFPRNFLKIFRTAFSENTSGRMLLSSDYSLKFSRMYFNPLMLSGNKRTCILKQTFN